MGLFTIGSFSLNEVFNIIGQLRSLERIKASGELENKTEKKEQITNDLGAKPKV